MATTVEEKTAAKTNADILRKQIVEEKLKDDKERRTKHSRAATQAMKPAAVAKQD